MINIHSITIDWYVHNPTHLPDDNHQDKSKSIRRKIFSTIRRLVGIYRASVSANNAALWSANQYVPIRYLPIVAHSMLRIVASYSNLRMCSLGAALSIVSQ